MPDMSRPRAWSSLRISTTLSLPIRILQVRLFDLDTKMMGRRGMRWKRWLCGDERSCRVLVRILATGTGGIKRINDTVQLFQIHS